MTKEAGCRRSGSVAAMATILHSADVPAGALVGARQPLAKKSGGFIRRRSVKRHQSRRHARNPDDVGAPAVDGDRRYLDEVLLAGNGFLKTMDDAIHRQRFVLGLAGARRNLRQRHTLIKRSDPRKPVHRRRRGPIAERGAGKIYFSCRAVHRKCTDRPQLFHRRVLLYSLYSSDIMRLLPHAAALGLLLAVGAASPAWAGERSRARRRGPGHGARWRDDFSGLPDRRHARSSVMASLPGSATGSCSRCRRRRISRILRCTW